MTLIVSNVNRFSNYELSRYSFVVLRCTLKLFLLSNINIFVYYIKDGIPKLESEAKV